MGHGNRVDRAARVVSARWWGLGLLAVARVAPAAPAPAPCGRVVPAPIVYAPLLSPGISLFFGFPIQIH
jgi:hypothetical protein